MNSDKPLDLTQHLKELRTRIIKSIFFIIFFSLVTYNYKSYILPFLTKPVGKLIFIAPQEAFITQIKVALFGGLFLASPFVLYQIWKFISVALKPKEKKYALIFGIISFVFFILGSIFGFFVIVPIGIKFLLGFATDLITPEITIGRYISFIGGLTFIFGIIFELPLILMFLTKVGIVTPEFLSKKRRESIVLVIIAAAIFTPPDIITQILMALPLILLYELGIFFSKVGYKKR